MVHSIEVEPRKKEKKKYRKNESDNNHTLPLDFFRIFSQGILGVGPKGLRMSRTFILHNDNNVKMIIMSECV